MNYRKETTVFLNKIKKAIKSLTGGFIPEEYEPLLTLLADNFDMYLDCRDAIKSEGIIVKTNKGEVKTNPIYNAMLNTESYIHKIMTSFGLTVMSKSKLKVLETVAESPDDVLGQLLA